MSGGDTSPNGPATPPPPRPPSGSPFGRFTQQPVLLIGLVALMVSLPVIALSVSGGDGGGGNASPADTPDAVDDLRGDWTGTLMRRAGRDFEVALTIRSVEGDEQDGELVRVSGGLTCRGSLSHDSRMGRSFAFAYRGQAGRDRCPRRSTVILSVVGDERLRIDELRGRRLVAQGLLTAR